MLAQSELQALRRYKGITQKEISKHIGISSRSYIDKEKGRTEFTLTEIYKISKLLNLPIEHIFLFENFPLGETEVK